MKKLNSIQMLILIAAIALCALVAVAGHPWLAVAAFVAVNLAMERPQARLCVNTLGTLAATQILVMEALALIYTKRPVLRNISISFTDRDPNGVPTPFAVLNQQVTTRTLGIPAVSAFGAAAAARADVDVPVTLNGHDQTEYVFTPAEYSATNRDLIRESVSPLTIAIANAMVDDVTAVITPANFPNRVGADAIANGAVATKTVVGAGWDYTHLTGVGSTLDNAGVPDFKRFYMCGMPVWTSFQNDPRIVGYFWNQNNGAAIQDGYLPRVNGFDIMKYPALPALLGNNIVAAAGSPDALVYAARAMRDPREMAGFADVPVAGIMTTITESILGTGLTLNMEMWIDMATLNANFRLHWLRGQAPGNKNNLQYVTNQ